MGVVRVIRGDDFRPYISLEDLIREVEFVKKSNDMENISVMDEKPEFIDVVLHTLHDMETEYYTKSLFRM